MVEEGQVQEVETNVEETPAEVDLNALAETVEKLKGTNDRLLAESKDWKAKYQGLRLERENIEKKELEDKESWKELLEKEKNERFQIEENFKNLKKTTLKKQLQFEVARHASDAHNLDTVLNTLPTDLLQIDEDNLSISGVKECIDSLRKDHGYLFKQESSPAMVNKRPSTMPTSKSIGEMNKNEKMDALGSALGKLFN